MNFQGKVIYLLLAYIILGSLP